MKLGRYRHYKGNYYQVLGVARHSETLEQMVIYQGEYGQQDVWVRPYDMFFEIIETEGKIVPRFQFVED